MTTEPENSKFTAQADGAALKLRQNLIERHGAQIPDSGAVEVGPDGKPPAPLPPEGSYKRMELEQLRQQQPAQPPQQSPPEPAVAETESQAPLQAPPTQPAEQLSHNAERRIQDLISQLREKDQQSQAAMAQAQQSQQTMSELQAKFESLQQQHNQMVEANLENLDPETRMQVMSDARIREQLGDMEQRIVQSVMPQVQALQQQNEHAEMLRLGDRYPGFDVGVHGELIQMFRQRNPSCSIEQAFKAVANPDELAMQGLASAQAAPPIVPPGNGTQMPRYAPEPQQQSDPQQELVEEAQMLRKMMESQDPKDHRMGLRLADQHIARRLNDMLPG